MGDFGIRYSAVVCYDYKDGERIVFVQQTIPEPANVVWRCEERYPAAGSYYCISDYKKPVHPLPMKDSIFNDMAVSYMIGFAAGKLGYSIDDIPQYFTQIKLYMEGLPCIVCANKYGVTFMDVHTKEPMYNQTARIWEGREEKSLYRVLVKMLSRIKDVYGMDYAISNFI